MKALNEFLNEKKKSEAAQFVLQSMDSKEDGQDKYEEFLKLALEKFPKVNKKELEKELDMYI